MGNIHKSVPLMLPSTRIHVYCVLLSTDHMYVMCYLSYTYIQVTCMSCVILSCYVCIQVTCMSCYLRMYFMYTGHMHVMCYLCILCIQVTCMSCVILSCYVHVHMYRSHACHVLFMHCLFTGDMDVVYRLQVHSISKFCIFLRACTRSRSELIHCWRFL